MEQWTDREFIGVEVDFSLAVLGGADLRGVDLSGCRFRETPLVGADLRKAVLRDADLTTSRRQRWLGPTTLS